MGKSSMIILYVADQIRSKEFYRKVLDQEPKLDVPGMTEFYLTDNFLLGLMPESGISKIVCPKMPEPSSGNGVPRCELYLIVKDPSAALQTAVSAGAVLISEAAPRDWGDAVAYCADPDGHIIALAK
jgi:predicted enzyme related to lactoylglutathione lyase